MMDLRELHAQWGIAFAAPMSGATLVLPGNALDGESVYNLLQGERVTVTAAVPTVWLGLLQYLEEGRRSLGFLKAVVIGGAAAPRAVVEKFEKVYNVEVSVGVEHQRHERRPLKRRA